MSKEAELRKALREAAEEFDALVNYFDSGGEIEQAEKASEASRKAWSAYADSHGG